MISTELRQQQGERGTYGGKHTVQCPLGSEGWKRGRSEANPGFLAYPRALVVVPLVKIKQTRRIRFTVKKREI